MAEEKEKPLVPVKDEDQDSEIEYDDPYESDLKALADHLNQYIKTLHEGRLERDGPIDNQGGDIWIQGRRKLEFVLKKYLPDVKAQDLIVSDQTEFRFLQAFRLKRKQKIDDIEKRLSTSFDHVLKSIDSSQKELKDDRKDKKRALFGRSKKK